MAGNSELPLHDLHVFMEQVTTEIASEYRRIYARSTEDPGTAGDEGEENWAALLRDWLPPTYHVETKGRLIGYDGTMSPQVDIVVLKPAYPRKLLKKKTWLAGGVAAAFECKNTLTAEHVSAAARRCVAFKSLFQPRTGSPRRELRSPLLYGVLSHSHSWKRAKSDPIANVEKALSDASTRVEHPRNLLDMICVADLAFWHRFNIACYEADLSPYEPLLRERFGGNQGMMTGHTCSSFSSHNQSSEFRPVGALLASLVNGLAWEDSAVRDLADYYRLAKLPGTGQGGMRPWPLSVYSNEVALQIMAGRLTNGILWDDWSIGGI